MSYKFFPQLTRLVTADSFPEQLNFIKGGIENMLNKLAYRNFRKRVSNKGRTVSYNLDILTTERVDYNIFGEDFILVLNPVEDDMSVIPINLTTYWGIRQYIRNFKLSSFSYTPESFFDLSVAITQLTDRNLLFVTAIAFCNESENPFNELATTFHNSYGLDISLPVNNDFEIAINEIITAVQTQDFPLETTILTEYIIDTNNINNSIENINALFAVTGNINIIDTIKKLLIPKIKATLTNITVALEFPRKWLIPIDPQSNQPIEDENEKSRLTFSVGSMRFSSENGIEFENESSVSFPKSQIGNTGFTLQFQDMKLDLSRSRSTFNAFKF